MFKLLTIPAIVAAMLAAWLAPAARSQTIRPAGNVELTPSQAVIEVHRQLHRHLVRVVGKKNPAGDRKACRLGVRPSDYFVPELQNSPEA